MPVTANIAPDINDIQTENFYFYISFIPPSADTNLESDSFSLSNLDITGTHISITDLTLLSLVSNTAIISVKLTQGVKGSFTINLTGTINVNGVDEPITYQSKKIEYDTTACATPQFTYDITPPPDTASEVVISLSSNGAQNGDVIIAQFDFNFDYHNFHANYVDVSPGVVKGTAVAIDDNNRRWVIPVTMPAQGQGDIEISLAENALFTHAAQSVRAQFAPSIALRMVGGDQTYSFPVNSNFSILVDITGSGVNYVNVEGLLRPFTHSWNATTGVLSIDGAPKKTYDNINFTIVARDNNSDEDTSVGTVNITVGSCTYGDYT